MPFATAAAPRAASVSAAVLPACCLWIQAERKPTLQALPGKGVEDRTLVLLEEYLGLGRA